tara:strand:+ start:331 stop:516 length:186 start_codon:yes stop_codon:yes gene_type:complete
MKDKLSKKEEKQVESIVKRILSEMLYEYEEDYAPEDYIIPTKCIEEIEKQMGRPITFMGIS